MTSIAKARMFIVYYSMHHHVHHLALAIRAGADRVPGVETSLFRVAETLPDNVLARIQRPPPLEDEVPVIGPKELAEADGLMFGMPARFGMMPTQMRALLDGTGSLWARNALRNKLAGTFFSTHRQHGGQETTALTAVTFMAHHGMLYMPLGFQHPALSEPDEVVGGGPYGSGTVAGAHGTRPSSKELDIAQFQGEEFAKMLVIMKRGHDILKHMQHKYP
ncbi:NAD(P)H:quinone oxidoreductase, type IV [Thamnocephalis sphaerospora]|uniref:NAD(P)H:quinone oxidoreductase, type IV n=1 Tax=Thamnocephalis sphaerospora TaxID=78915 RepID=A0A4P9XU09_9FUNG|nr:NAD(P)H:quinone oxidoreductase, type IV [Thamnocephalis sphaerospora]|eukprot:RKP09695.1 NAD(P)H:quinone oxidoreductase, type IV [Thamnocephalis sphaerospora]